MEQFLMVEPEATFESILRAAPAESLSQVSWVRRRELVKLMESGGYLPEAHMPKAIQTNGKQREIYTLPADHAAVQKGVAQCLSEALDDLMSDSSHGFRPGRSIKTAVANLYSSIRARGATFLARADIEGFFNSVPRHEIMEILRSVELELPTRRLTELILQCAEKMMPPSKGVPTGWPIIPVLANMVLTPVDQYLTLCEYNFVRFADDFAFAAVTQAEGNEFLDALQVNLRSLDLTLKESVSKAYPLDEKPIRFLGHEFVCIRGEILVYPARKNLHTIQYRLNQMFKKVSVARNRKKARVLLRQARFVIKGWNGTFCKIETNGAEHPNKALLSDANEYFQRFFESARKHFNLSRDGLEWVPLRPRSLAINYYPTK